VKQDLEWRKSYYSINGTCVLSSTPGILNNVVQEPYLKNSPYIRQFSISPFQIQFGVELFDVSVQKWRMVTNVTSDYLQK
jgi:hypothetical protein